MLHGIPFRNPGPAHRNLLHLDPALSGETRGLLISLLRQSPDPDAALASLERYVAEDPSRVPVSGSRLHALLAVFAHSRFLSDTLFQQRGLLEQTLNSGDLYRVVSAEELRAALAAWLRDRTEHPDLALALATFKRRALLRIVMRDVLGLATLAEVTLELSNLADALLETALESACQDLIQIHGRPSVKPPGPSRTDCPIECEFVILALGKLGGQELNYSSDIDLMYLYTGPGETDGPSRISAREFSIRLARQVTSLLSAATPHGFCYRVDLRLRPEGSLGEMALPLDGALDYYHHRARDWELQMLLKARVAAGGRRLGRQFLEQVEPLIYRTTTDFSAVESVSETRERIHEKLRRRAPSGLDIKLTHGGIRDIEFLVQCLQRLYGGRDPWVRHGGTLFALHRLRDKGYLAARDYARLHAAYHFLRTLEHRLQMENDRQTHTLPQDEGALQVLARKMGFTTGSGAILLAETQRHLREVAAIYERVIHGHDPAAQAALETPPLFQLEMERPQEPAELSMQAQLRFLEKRAPELASRVAAAPLNRGRRLFEHFLGKLISMPDLVDTLNHRPELVDLAADLFEHSPYFAEVLIRNPEEVQELLKVATVTSSDQQAPLFPLEAALLRRDNPELDHLIRTEAPVADKLAWLRRFYRRQMLRIQSESICRRSPIFATLDQTTELADWVVDAAYRIARDDVARSGSLLPAGRDRPRYLMHAVALGRLGMREFDLGSDADLVFILPDAAQDEMSFWTRVAERLIDVLTSYTGEGVIFSVDTRLRPLGREGELLQTESRYKQYFAEKAQAWEAITYMKTRCVAGDIEKGTAFLHDLQNVDWRRYGQSGSLAGLLGEMRRRLEKEQGGEQPLKAGKGGYYDIDFALMFLRLRGAGIFYKSLNTPERIEVIERMGLLGPEHAEFLRAAAVFYRALDHGLRVSTGRSQGSLSTAPSQAAILTELVRRWTPPALHDRPLDELLDQMRHRTRHVFDQIFGNA